MERALRPNEQVEEFYVLTWESPKEMIFEMPVRRRYDRPLPRVRNSSGVTEGLEIDRAYRAPQSTVS